MFDWLLTATGILAFVSPPFLLFWAWWRFYRSRREDHFTGWRNSMAWMAIVSITGFFLVSLAAFLVLPCDVDHLGWSCLVKWGRFTKYALLAAPALVCLAPFAPKGTRIQLALSVLAVAYDCVVISASA